VLVDLYRAGRIRLGTMLEPIALRDINRAFDQLRAGRAGRAVVVF
jgi:Zn-dependent alcohol dehydrogenase